MLEQFNGWSSHIALPMRQVSSIPDVAPEFGQLPLADVYSMGLVIFVGFAAHSLLELSQTI